MSDWIDAAYHWLADMSIKGVTLRDSFQHRMRILTSKRLPHPRRKIGLISNTVSCLGIIDNSVKKTLKDRMIGSQAVLYVPED